MKGNKRQRDLENLARLIRRCTKCPLRKSRIKAVPGEGPCPAGIMLIGEAPGKAEDLLGRPFVGPSGKLLDYLLKSIGISRNQAYITSSVKCRPPKNRTPHTNELRICKANWLNRQIDLINPKIIVLLGKTALKQVLGLEGNLDDLHGRLIRKNNIKYLITFHPASAMRFPSIKRKTLSDFNALKYRL